MNICQKHMSAATLSLSLRGAHMLLTCAYKYNTHILLYVQYYVYTDTI